jgi:CRP-like cAMP-binding protein
MSHGAFENEGRFDADDAPASSAPIRATPPPRTDEVSVIAGLLGHPVFAGVPRASAEAVLKSGALRTFNPGEHVAREGDRAEHYALLASGSLRVFYSSRDGAEVTVQLYGAPAAWGEIQLLHDQRCTENIVAIDRARVLLVPKAQFLELMREEPAFMMNVLRDASARLLLATRHERATALLGVQERVTDLLLSYVRMYGVPVDGGTMIRIPLSQGDLAQGLGVALKSVSRAFAELITDGVIEKRGPRWVVKSLEALRAKTDGLSSGIDWVAGRRLDSAA